MNTQPEQLAAALSLSRRGGKFSTEPVNVPAEFSDDALALRFTEEHGGDLRYPIKLILLFCLLVIGFQCHFAAIS